MAARILDGKSLAAQVRAEVKREVAALAQRGIRPGLAVVLAGENPASKVYVRNKVRACEETGVRSELFELPASVSEEALIDRVLALNDDAEVHGILVQLPLPKQVDAHKVLATVAAVGRAKLVTGQMVKPGACVIDVGVNRLRDGSLAGDVDFASVAEVAGWITPVPGGVGPMTIAMLLENCLRAAGAAK